LADLVLAAVDLPHAVVGRILRTGRYSETSDVAAMPRAVA
jgi:hypothetical protein